MFHFEVKFDIRTWIICVNKTSLVLCKQMQHFLVDRLAMTILNNRKKEPKEKVLKNFPINLGSTHKKLKKNHKSFSWKKHTWKNNVLSYDKKDPKKTFAKVWYPQTKRNFPNGLTLFRLQHFSIPRIRET